MKFYSNRLYRILFDQLSNYDFCRTARKLPRQSQHNFDEDVQYTSISVVYFWVTGAYLGGSLGHGPLWPGEKKFFTTTW